MHKEAHAFVARYRTNARFRLLDIGGRDVNGTCRDLFPNAEWTVLDVRPGPRVDIVADATKWDPEGQTWNLILCTEVLEHVARPLQVLHRARWAAHPGSAIIVTTAGPSRKLHSGIDGGPRLHEGECYANLTLERLQFDLITAGWSDVHVERRRDDLYASALNMEPVK